jgi:hypothetical protein
MPRHKFTLFEQLIATERALNSPDTPKQLRDSLRARASTLRTQVADQESRRRGLLGILGRARRRK